MGGNPNELGISGGPNGIGPQAAPTWDNYYSRSQKPGAGKARWRFLSAALKRCSGERLNAAKPFREQTSTGSRSSPSQRRSGHCRRLPHSLAFPHYAAVRAFAGMAHDSEALKALPVRSIIDYCRAKRSAPLSVESEA